MSKVKSIPAVSLKNLIGMAPTFEMPVQINVRGADPVTIHMSCKAMGKLAWAKLRDASNDVMRDSAGARIKAAKEEEARLHVADVVSEAMQSDVRLILEFATKWDLEDELTADNLQRLEESFGGAMRAMIEAYETAVYQSKLGN